MRNYCWVLAAIFQANRTKCHCQKNWHKILSGKQFFTTQTISPPDKEKEEKLLHMQTMARYKKSFEYCDLKPRQRNYMYISHRDAVDLAVRSYLCSEIHENELVLEINPGLGILTKALLEAGIPRLRVFEDKPIFLRHLRKLSESYPGRMEIMEEDFFHVPYDAMQKEEKFDRLLQGITQRKWKDVPTKVFIIPPIKYEGMFMKSLILSVPNAENIFKIGRVEFFMFLSGKEYAHMIAKPNDNYSSYLNASVLYSLLFDIQLFGKVERSHFFSLLRLRKLKFQMYDNKNMYFVKMTPKADIYDNGMTSEKLIELIHFVQICLRKRKRNVLSTLESYVPNCGPLFIKHGITFLENFGDLAPQEFLEIFNVFASLPEYEMFKMKSDLYACKE